MEKDNVQSSKLSGGERLDFYPFQKTIQPEMQRSSFITAMLLQDALYCDDTGYLGLNGAQIPSHHSALEKAQLRCILLDTQ